MVLKGHTFEWTEEPALDYSVLKAGWWTAKFAKVIVAASGSYKFTLIVDGTNLPLTWSVGTSESAAWKATKTCQALGWTKSQWRKDLEPCKGESVDIRIDQEPSLNDEDQLIWVIKDMAGLNTRVAA